MGKTSGQNMRRRWIAGAAAAALVLTGSSAYAAIRWFPGPQGDGTGVTPYDWKLTPAGQSVTLGNFPMGGALSPDGRYLVVSNDGDGVQSLQVVDTRSQQVVQTIPYNAPEALYLGVAFSPDGQHLYVSAGGNDKIRVYSFNAGHLTEQNPIAVKGTTDAPMYPGGLCVSLDGRYLYVANNLNNSVARINLAQRTVDKVTQVGKNPYTVALSADGRTLYASNWGEDTVSVLNAETMQTVKTLKVGLHPNALAVNAKTGCVYVADGDSDQISIIDPATQSVTKTLSLAPYRGALPGSEPDSLAVSADGRTLYVANAGNNDVAVVALDQRGYPEANAVQGLIPTAWYPTGVFVSSDNRHLFVMNAKGLGAGPNKDGQYIGNMMMGTLQFVDVPDAGQLKRYTAEVRQNNRGPESSLWWHLPFQDNSEVPVPRYQNQHSPIKHVIYVIKENRTYDQVFGDLGKGNGDPSLTMFGRTITPNLHALANQFVTLDNFYADAEVSAQGHNWSTAADSDDYVEKNWMANYSGRGRGYDFEGTNSATYPEDGFLWDDALRAHVSFRDYGEFESYLPNTGLWAPDDPSVGDNYDPHYPGWNLDISDLTRFDEWNREFQQYCKNGNLPQLEILRLPNDHTKGTTPGALTPQAYVAQNDYALGKLVDAVSHSRYWKDTAIFVVEDDAQNGLDHVDAHRTEALVISPYTQTGRVDSTFYDTASMLRTMELILGMKPLTQYDAAAMPMVGAFTNKPNFQPYNVKEPQYPIDKTNSAHSPGAAESARMDWSHEDEAPEQQLNHILWEATMGKRPYPHVTQHSR
ncbi:bifunctional YncE family protein/alkaline phosphatase family protein [Alicyclobacillus herbarius]|uniref:bifunctional YncE family protein/alkaline phosphatase family protein n=1 Tax=Alicyclobacillus herbarius TaxID=122960 RepID=UPI0023561A99|nr:bifunctional YncE family protein/alkaline phosphatase family protein [Alicyclobacillus herbarius]